MNRATYSVRQRGTDIGHRKRENRKNRAPTKLIRGLGFILILHWRDALFGHGVLYLRHPSFTIFCVLRDVHLGRW